MGITGAASLFLTLAFTGAVPNADDVFAQAKQYVARCSYPAYASYDVAVAFSKDGRRVHDTWETHEDIAHATVFAQIFSREETVHPSTPHGINVAIPFIGKYFEEKKRDPIGTVAFAVDQTFGLFPKSYAYAKDISTLAKAATGLRVIGGAATRSTLYDVVLLDSTAAGAAGTYHLGLTPLKNPKVNRLRELWVDASSMMPVSAIVQGIGNRGPLEEGRWKIDFIEQDGGIYVSGEHALAPVTFFGETTLTDVAVLFQNLRLSSTFPLKYAFGIASDTNPVRDP